MEMKNSSFQIHNKFLFKINYLLLVIHSIIAKLTTTFFPASEKPSNKLYVNIMDQHANKGLLYEAKAPQIITLTPH